MLCISCHYIPLKPLTLRVDSAKLLDVLTLLPVSHSILPRAVCFATSRPANHAICSFIDSSGYASGPIRRCLFIDYIIIWSIGLNNIYPDYHHAYQEAFFTVNNFYPSETHLL